MRQKKMRVLLCIAASCLLFALIASSQELSGQKTVPLLVPAGVPLRLYVTKRFSKKLNAPVQASLLTPVYAFDRPVIPAGAAVVGHVSALQPVSGWRRARAILGGDFTPLHVAAVDFTSLSMPGGAVVILHGAASSGLNTLVPVLPASPPTEGASPASVGVLAARKRQARQQVSSGVSRIKSIPATVRAANKKEWLYDFLMSKLPYHPQYVRSRTRFDAELTQALDFGALPANGQSFGLLGTQPTADSIVHARLLTALNSNTAVPGQRVEAVLEQPLTSAGHEVVLPEGTHLSGEVVLAKRAGWFHHAGRLRFRFQEIALSPDMARLKQQLTAPTANSSEARDRTLQLRTQGLLSAAEGGKGGLKVDKEGEVQAKDSKTRFIGTALAAFIARSAADNDPIRSPGGAITGHSSNVGGRTLGGGIGFGLLGTIAAQSSRTVGTALGYYGLAWSVFSTVIARGPDVEFDRNAVIDVAFGARPAAEKAKALSK